MKQFNVTGMSCAACQARVEKAVSAVPGVSVCSVSLLTNSMGVEGDASDEMIVRAVEKAGYGASPKDGADRKNVLEDKETPLMKKRLVCSVVLLVILMYFSMGVHMFSWPVPGFLSGNHVSMGILQLIISGLILVINRKYFTSGFNGLFHLAPNMDTLIAIGSMAAFVYSTAMLFAMSTAQVTEGSKAAAAYMNELYYESAAMILTLVTVGKTLESYSKGRTTDALKSLMKLAPETANVIRDGAEITIGLDEILTGDIFVVRPGENIPVDGIVAEGVSAVDESALTGESIPVDKEAGSTVSSGTLNQSGFLKCQATRVGKDTTLSKIIEMVSDAAATKAPVAKLADRISGVFVPAVILLAIIVTFVWLFLGQTAGYALSRGISVLVVSCPCALGLATPVAIMVGNGVGARCGILFKTAEALQETGSIQIIALDKTGTITNGTPTVTDFCAAEGVTENDFLIKAASLEQGSEHPLASAVTAYAKEKGVTPKDITDFSALFGNGLTAVLEGKRLTGGSVSFVSSAVPVSDAMIRKAGQFSEAGRTPVLFAEDDRLIGIMGIADSIKEDSAEAIEELKNMGIHTVMLTGDNTRTAEAVGKQAGVDEVIAEVMPGEKEEVIRRLQKKGKVAMVGDGINDAPALTRADTGIAVAAGTDVAADAADVVLMKSSLKDVAAAVRLSERTLVIIKENLFWALIYNVLLIPLACGVYARFGLTMNPMWGAAAMSCSSIFVVTNALRLNMFKVYDNTRDKKRKRRSLISENEKGVRTMTKTVSIEGMMCAHCESNVKAALEALDGVESADVSHERNEAVLTLSKDVDETVIRKTVEDKGYKFVSVK